MARTYKGSLSLEWYNKQKAILLKTKSSPVTYETPAPAIAWVNQEGALFYEVAMEEGKGQEPFWVEASDIRVKEARPLSFQKTFRAVKIDEPGTIPGTSISYGIEQSDKDDPTVSNWLIRGDNLLALNALKKHFDNSADHNKVKCIYIDPPYNTGAAFENYEDSLEHSEWLTMMRDRLVVLKSLLQESGTIFVSIDNTESSYLQLLMDSIFGRQNRKNIITVKRGSVTGAKVINPGLVNISEFVLVYSKDTEVWQPNRILRSRERDDRYNTFIENFEDPFSNWRFCSLLEACAGHLNVEKKGLKSRLGESFESKLVEFVYANADRVVRFAALDENSVSKDAIALKRFSENDEGKTFKLDREGKRPYYIHQGQLILFVKDRLAEIDGNLTFSEPVTDIWDDVLPNDLHNEGGVDFRKGKKPEKLIQRMLEMASEPGDFILDCFGGSGSTFAVAHKMNRRWIGVEIGNHADTHIIPRLCSVLSGTDKAGITKAVDWNGGGSFKYYHLGPSIITIDKEGKGDFNWSLGTSFIEESLLQSYDYSISRDIDLAADKLFTDKKSQPVIGVQRIGSKTRVAIVSLNEPSGVLHSITFDEIQYLYKAVKSKYSPEYVNIFTNRGIEIAYDSKPGDLEVIKVPHAIFAELES